MIMRNLLTLVACLFPLIAFSQGGPIIRNPITTNAFMNQPQNGWIAIWNNVAGRWSNGVNTASATNDSQPPSTVLSNLTQTGVSPGATNAGFYIGSSNGLGTNTAIHGSLTSKGKTTNENGLVVFNDPISVVNTNFGEGAAISMTTYDGIAGSFIDLRRSRGTVALPTKLFAADLVSDIAFYGMSDSTIFRQAAMFEVNAISDFTTTAESLLNLKLGTLAGGAAVTRMTWTPYGTTNIGDFGVGGNSIVFGNDSIGGNLLVGGIASLNALDVTSSLSSTSTNLIDSQSEDATPANGDYVLVHDVSTASLTKVQLGNLPGGGGGGGGTTNAFTGGILWVDKTNGNDALAIATGGRDFMHPWATFTNALRYATNGDTVRVGPGTWNITNGIAAIMPVGVHLQGSGRRSSFITNSLVLNSITAGQGVGIPLATDSMVSGFYLAIDAHTNQYRAQIGAVFLTALGLTHNRAFTNAVISDCEIEGGTDAVFVRHDSVCTLRIYNCTIRGKSDVLVFGDNAGSSIEIYNVDSRAIGPYALYPQTDGFIFLSTSAIIENSSSYASNNVNWNKAMDLRSGAHVIVRNSKFLAGGTNPTNIFGEAGTLLELQTEDGYDTNRVFAPVLLDRKTFIEASTTTSGVPITNRFTSDYIGSSSATAIGLGTSNTFRWVVDSDGQMYPFVDAIKAIGRDANRVKAIHTVTSVVNQIKMVNGQATNSFLYLNATTNVAVGAFGSGLSFSGGTLTSSGGSGSTNNVAQGIGTSDTTNALKRHWVHIGDTTNIVLNWSVTNVVVASPSNNFTISWINEPTTLDQTLHLELWNTNSTAGFFPTNHLDGTSPTLLPALSTNTYQFRWNGHRFYVISGQIETSGLGDVYLLQQSPTITTPILPTGATTNRAATREYALTMTNAAGLTDWTPMTTKLSSRRRSWFLPTTTTILQCGMGEFWALTGNQGLIEATATEPASLYVTNLASSGSDAGINGNGFKFWQPGRGSGLHWTAGITLGGTNATRQWIGLTAGSISQMDSAQPNFKIAAFQYESTVNSHFWFVTANAGSAWQTNDTQVVATDNVLRHFEIVEDVAGARWYGVIDGVVVATNTVNLPTTAMQSNVSTHTQEALAKTNKIAYIEVTGNY